MNVEERGVAPNMAEGSLNEEAAKGWCSEGKCEFGDIRNKRGTICEPCCYRAKVDKTKIQTEWTGQDRLHTDDCVSIRTNPSSRGWLANKVGTEFAS